MGPANKSRDDDLCCREGSRGAPTCTAWLQANLRFRPIADGAMRSLGWRLMAHANELDLDHAFWNALTGKNDFRVWLLQRTKFCSQQLDLVTDEKWHQRWYRDPETRKDSETDILLIWRESTTGGRVALHIENKPAHRAWEPSQASNYRRRAENRMKPWRYSDFEVALLAPAEFIARHLHEASQFDFVLTYEDVGGFAPEFEGAVPVAQGELAPLDRLRVELLRRSVSEDELERQPWLAEVRHGAFDAIPESLGWSESAPLAHLIRGYDLLGVEGLQSLANERLDLARRSGQWVGNSLELWACLYGEHRRAHHSGYGPTGDELRLFDALCTQLRSQLLEEPREAV